MMLVYRRCRAKNVVGTCACCVAAKAQDCVYSSTRKVAQLWMSDDPRGRPLSTRDEESAKSGGRKVKGGTQTARTQHPDVHDGVQGTFAPDRFFELLTEYR